MAEYGLLGRNIEYSFSCGFFSKKFERERIKARYINLDFENIDGFMDWFNHQNDLHGFNVTIPYKETIIPFLDSVDPVAATIGAVNTVVISRQGQLRGYNTDQYGFTESLNRWNPKMPKKAIILGTGGAAKAVKHALTVQDYEGIQLTRQKLSIKDLNDQKHTHSAFVLKNYKDMTPEIVDHYSLIINCTPAGTFPNINEAPEFPYHAIHSGHYLYDLIYNPEKTEFLKRGQAAGAHIKNGLEMLELQALAAWDLWQKAQ